MAGPGRGGTTYDEELTPEIDPPLIEPPPTATLLGRIFAHRRGRRTVVSAPLVRVDGGGEQAPAAEPAVPEPAPDEDPRLEAPEPEPDVEPAPVSPAPAETPVTPVEVAPPAEPVDVVAPPAEPVEPVETEEPVEPAAPVETVEPADTDDARATRYCAMCGDRVPVDADGLHCYLGHRLSPAHAEPPRRGLLRRLFGRR